VAAVTQTVGLSEHNNQSLRMMIADGADRHPIFTRRTPGFLLLHPAVKDLAITVSEMLSTKQAPVDPMKDVARSL
jgi:hypothetical protein